ncbi:hypothetical protein BS47DRAFT_1389320 [Hydnum rufescens UP504]|uniref:Uncharacterized protein n=1 Tax=Hydnum rufescens UP504 TaxID=1448309 RepID=A0A9P6B673_9AGAM|nr:hypothetical protein BS47DRAFT_1389320 [Hydnum rufescens UP504]
MSKTVIYEHADVLMDDENDYLITNWNGHLVELTDMRRHSPKRPYVNWPPKRGDPTAKESDNDEDLLLGKKNTWHISSSNGYTIEPMDMRHHGPKHPYVNRPPKKDCSVNAVFYDSDDNPIDEISDSSDLDTDDQAKKYYKRQLQNEHTVIYHRLHQKLQIHS